MSDLDDEELEATRRLNGVDKKDSIEKDIKRCEELIKPEHANWIGISNQLAIAHVVDRVKELEAKLEFKNWGDLDNIQFEEYMNQFIPKQKVKEIVDECILKKENIITRQIEYSPNTNDNSYLVEEILKLLEDK